MKVAEMMNGIRQRGMAAIFIASIVAGPLNVSASTEEWLGGDNNDSAWTSNGNWVGVGGARANDDLFFRSHAPRFGFNYSFCPDICTPTERRTNFNDFPVNTSFNSLTFSEARYVISGNQIFLAAGIKADAIETIFNPNITLGSTQTWSGGGRLELNGVVNLNGRSLLLKDGGQVFDGPITGGGTIVKTGGGKATLNGNFFAVSSQISGGNLEVNGIAGLISLHGGTLSGTGTAGRLLGLVQDGGTISPGRGEGVAGTLRNNSDVDLSSAITLVVDLNGTVAGTMHDQFRNTNGVVNITGVDLDVRLGFVPNAGQQFTILSHLGIGGIFGKFEQQNAFVKDNILFQITYLQDSVVLTCLGPAIP